MVMGFHEINIFVGSENEKPIGVVVSGVVQQKIIPTNRLAQFLWNFNVSDVIGVDSWCTVNFSFALNIALQCFVLW